MKIYSNEKIKLVEAPGYVHIFNKHTGACARWGCTKDEDPDMAPAPELLDIEISVVLTPEEAEPYRNDENFIVLYLRLLNRFKENYETFILGCFINSLSNSFSLLLYFRGTCTLIFTN